MALNRVQPAQFAQAGATDGQVMTWDNALTTWKPATPSGGGSSSGISGAVQFSGGSGAFSSDATNFFFNDTTNQLQLNGGTTYQLLLAGQNGGLDSTPASAITGGYNAFRSNTSATGYVNILLSNTNSSSATAHARVSLTTVPGGGDPFLNLSTSEAGYVIGVDNSDSDKLYIGVGTNPSTMTSANITLSGDMTGIMQTTPTAILHLGAGTTTDAPLKFTSGTNLSSAQAGAVEWDGTRLYITQTTGPTRKTIAFTSDVTGVADGDYGDVTVSGSGSVWTVDAVNFNKITNAANTGTLDNTNFSQTWNWSTLSTGTGLSIGAAGLTTGNLVNINSSNASFNSNNGLLQVVNNGTSTNGTVFKAVSNGNIAGAGLIVKANGTVGIGLTSSTAMLHLGGTPNLANGSTNGMFFRADASGVTDTSTATSGTVAHTAVSAFNTPQLFAANTGVTYTNASTLYIGGAPTAGTNVTITNGYALWINGALKLDLGSDATGDIYYRNSSGKFTRLPIGADSTALTISGGIPAWSANALGDVSGPASSVDSEIALFSGTNGKVIKRATGTGVAIVTSGVLSTKTNPSGAFVGDTDTQTITNKRINPRVTSTASSSTPTPNADTDDMYQLTALAAGATFGSPTGTPVNGQRLLIRVKDNGTARTLAYNAIYRAVGVTLPSTTVVNKTLYLGCIYNSADTKWDILAVGQEA